MIENHKCMKTHYFKYTINRKSVDENQRKIARMYLDFALKYHDFAVENPDLSIKNILEFIEKFMEK